jgi:hypothetical protein
VGAPIQSRAEPAATVIQARPLTTPAPSDSPSATPGQSPVAPPPPAISPASIPAVEASATQRLNAAPPSPQR